MSKNLKFLAGPKALREIQRDGLDPNRIKVIAGAAGGPKWLMLSRMDHVWFGSFLAKRKEPLLLVGSSIGAWRMAVSCFNDPVQGFKDFEDAYINQRYRGKPTKQEVSQVVKDVLDLLITPERVQQILNHPVYQLNVVTARSRGPLAFEPPLLQAPGLLMSALANACSRSLLKHFHERVFFQHGESQDPFYHNDPQPVRRVILNEQNLRPALSATGAIPMVIDGVRNIPGAPRGSYRDGGVIDYHFDIPYGIDDGIVLFPHFTQRIIPGWFDKSLGHRKPKPKNMENVLMVAASNEYIQKLPRGKIPDRNDFEIFAGRDDERITYWEQITEQNQSLADELAEVLDKNDVGSLVEPLC